MMSGEKARRVMVGGRTKRMAGLYQKVGLVL